MKSEGNLVDTIPEGFEIYENPNAQVFLRRIRPKVITDAEIETVRQGMNVQDFVNRFTTFSPMLRFVLIDEKQRQFITQLPKF